MPRSNQEMLEPLLVVEDSRSFASLLLGTIRQQLSHPVTLAKSYDEAVHAVQSAKTPFLLAILDLYIPGAPNGEIVDLILKQGIPAVVLTGMYKKDLQDRILAKGILDYFVKDNIGVIDSVIHFIRRFHKNKRIRVLAVDDSRSVRVLLANFLKRYGFVVLQAEDGQKALEILEKEQVHLVITDYQMPRLDGIQLLKKVRAFHSRDELAVIGLSSISDGDLSVQFIKAGANDFLVKPFENEELLCRVTQNIEIIERHHELEKMVKRHQSLLENALDAIITTDSEGTVLDFNPAAEKLFGYAKKEILGGQLTNFIVPLSLQEQHQQGMVHYVKSIASGDNTVLRKRFEIPGKRSNGEIVDLQVALTSVQQKDDLSFTAFLQDITDRKQLLRSLEETLRAAESANRAKSEFIANMSHEIRTPMNAVMGFTDLALKNELTPKIRDYLEKVEVASHSLMGIINDILDFSKIEAGQMDLDPVRFDISDLFDRLADLFSKQVADRGLELILLPPLEYDSVLFGDVLRIEQVLINLIRNAIKFTHEGSIVVHAAVEEREDKKVQLSFMIRDTGIGIDPDRLNKLFNPFVQGDGSTTRKYGGTGLGLTICKRLVERMDGRIWVTSTPGQGSVFSFTVMAAFASVNRRKKMTIPGDLFGKRVLVLDDNELILELLPSMLERLSLKPLAVRTLEEALVLLFEHNFGKDPIELMLIDWSLNEQDGGVVTNQILKRLRETTPPARIPKIILTTSFGEDKFKQLSQESGIDIFLDKPITNNRLITAVSAAFGKERPVNERRVTKVLAQDYETAEVIGGARILLVEDNVINQQVARELLERVGLMVEIANNGREALDRIEKFSYDAVLMDLQMPDMDGFEATTLLRNDDRFKNLPIIAMTAHALESERKRCIEIGMNGHIAKPIRPERMYGVLTKVIGPLQVLPKASNFKRDQLALPELSGINMKGGLERVGGNAKLYYRILLRFRKDQLRLAEELRSTVKSGNRIEASRLAHSTIGVAGNIGADGLCQVAQELESLLGDQNVVDWHELVERFIAELEPILDSLKVLDDVPLEPLEPSSEVEGDGLCFDVEGKEAVVATLHELVDLLDANSIEVGDCFSRLNVLLPCAACKKSLKAIEGEVDDYNFSRAMEIVNELAARLKLPLEGGDHGQS
ncbi:MAG: response regulator [Magnetococcales bacterium]|nr:response regulator [Magnetococcales bacterium]MBF0149539.1 response regulator [Magnetococcales bacterium]MBF0174322.1 response regulator [Magnetococcales bacterium]MBF0631925.1 response regulator [Magnetococcales bacterium]